MHILELKNMELKVLKLLKESEIFEIKTSKKVFYLKAESKSLFNFWREKIQLQISLIQQNAHFSDFDNQISNNEKKNFVQQDSILYQSFEKIENLLYDNLLREWFFQYISEISPEEGGLLLLLEFYIKFREELKAENYKEAFKNCNRIYEIIRKVSEDWKEKCCLPSETNLPEPEEERINNRANLFKRTSKPLIMLSNSEKKSPVHMKMYHMKNNTPSSEKKVPNKNAIDQNKMVIKRSTKNKINVKVEFTEIKIPQKNLKPRHRTRKNIKEEQLPKIDEFLNEEMIFHEDFFVKIFKNFDWENCEKKFFYMKDVYLMDGIECQIIDLFVDLFINVVKYLEMNYYTSFLESAFYKRKLLFFQIEEIKKKMIFEKPSFFEKKQNNPQSFQKNINLNHENRQNFHKKKVVAAYQIEDIRNIKFAEQNPYSMFQESEKNSLVIDASIRRQITFGKNGKEPIKKEKVKTDDYF